MQRLQVTGADIEGWAASGVIGAVAVTVVTVALAWRAGGTPVERETRKRTEQERRSSRSTAMRREGAGFDYLAGMASVATLPTVWGVIAYWHPLDGPPALLLTAGVAMLLASVALAHQRTLQRATVMAAALSYLALMIIDPRQSPVFALLPLLAGLLSLRLPLARARVIVLAACTVQILMTYWFLLGLLVPGALAAVDMLWRIAKGFRQGTLTRSN